MTVRQVAALLSGFLTGAWPAGLLVLGLGVYRFRGLPLLGFTAAFAVAARGSRTRWSAAVTAGLGAAFVSHLLVVGAEWRFIALAFGMAMPLMAGALAGAIARLALDHRRRRLVEES